jgi:hypothetical protein
VCHCSPGGPKGPPYGVSLSWFLFIHLVIVLLLLSSFNLSYHVGLLLSRLALVAPVKARGGPINTEGSEPQRGPRLHHSTGCFIDPPGGQQGPWGSSPTQQLFARGFERIHVKVPVTRLAPQGGPKVPRCSSPGPCNRSAVLIISLHPIPEAQPAPDIAITCTLHQMSISK